MKEIYVVVTKPRSPLDDPGVDVFDDRPAADAFAAEAGSTVESREVNARAGYTRRKIYWYRLKTVSGVDGGSGEDFALVAPNTTDAGPAVIGHGGKSLTAVSFVSVEHAQRIALQAYETMPREQTV